MDNALKLKKENGFSLIEVMFAAFFVSIALLAIGMTMVQGVAAVYNTQEQLIAKQKAREALESVFTARSTQEITFPQIQNTSVANGIFLEGFQSIRGMGVDGIANTADDSLTDEEFWSSPGPDGLLGTADDEIIPLTNYQRQVTLASVLDTNGNVDPDLRMITIEVRFKTRDVWRSVTVSSLVSRFS